MNQRYSIVGAACTTLLITAMPALAQTSDTPEITEDTMMMEDSEATAEVQSLNEALSTDATDLKLRPQLAIKRTTDVNGAEGLNYVGGFIPIYQRGISSDFKMLFFNGGVSVDDDGEFGSNILFGYRTLNETNYIFGSYLGLDIRGTEEDNSFSQFTFGIESLSETIDARTNIFLSLSDRKAITAETANNFRFTGNRLLFDTSQRFQAAASGFDFEVGSKLTDWRQGDLRAYAGLYYYNINGGENSVGWRTRLVARPTPSMNVGLTLQDDGIFGTRLSFAIGALFPSSSPSSALTASAYEEGYNPMIDRLSDRFVKNSTVIIDNYTDQTGEGIAATNPETGNDWFFSFADLGASGNGTFESPFGTFQQALDATGSFPNDSVAYVLNGGTFNAAAGLTIPEGVIFMSDGVAQVLPIGNLPSANNETTAILPSSGTGNLPTIENSDLIVFSNDTTIDGFDLNGGLFIEDVGGDITIAENVITDATEKSINIQNTAITDGGTITIIDNTIESTADDVEGIEIEFYSYSSGGDIIISGNTINTGDEGSEGIEIDIYEGSTTGSILISDNVIDSDNEGIEIDFGGRGSSGNTSGFSDDITITGNTITTDDNEGIDIDIDYASSVGNITISDNVIDVDEEGIEIQIDDDSTVENIVISGNTIEAGTEGVNIQLERDNGPFVGNITISDNVIESSSEGLEIDIGRRSSSGSTSGFSEDITITGNTITTDNDEGVDIDINYASSVGNITVSNNVIDADEEGIEIQLDDDSTAEDIVVSGNTIEAGNEGVNIQLDRDDGPSVGNITISENVINADEEGIEIRLDDDSTAEDIVVSGNTIEATEDAIFLNLDESSVGVVNVMGNDVTSGGNGVALDNDSGSSVCAVISGNTVEDSGGSSFQYVLDGGDAIELDGMLPTGNVSIGGNVTANTGCDP